MNIVSPGYIGGSVLIRFLDRLDTDSIELTALVRSPVKAEKLKQLGVHAVVGTLEDDGLLEQLASDADVVIDTVSLLIFVINALLTLIARQMRVTCLQHGLSSKAFKKDTMPLESPQLSYILCVGPAENNIYMYI